MELKTDRALKKLVRFERMKKSKLRKSIMERLAKRRVKGTKMIDLND
jgi:hypothetical protein